MQGGWTRYQNPQIQTSPANIFFQRFSDSNEEGPKLSYQGGRPDALNVYYSLERGAFMKRNERGIYLMEVSLVVGLISTIAYLSYGSLREVRRGFIIDSTTRELTSTLTIARSEAIRNGNPVIVTFGARHMTPFFDVDGDEAFHAERDKRLRPAQVMPLFCKVRGTCGGKRRPVQ